jgi:hypothetical protein
MVKILQNKDNSPALFSSAVDCVNDIYRIVNVQLLDILVSVGLTHVQVGSHQF